MHVLQTNNIWWILTMFCNFKEFAVKTIFSLIQNHNINIIHYFVFIINLIK